jgi:hypothetical protein
MVRSIVMSILLVKVKVKVTLEQSTKAQRGSKVIALSFLTLSFLYRASSIDLQIKVPKRCD